MSKLKKYHEDWLFKSNMPLLELNGNIDYEKIVPPQWYSKIMTFIQSKVVPKMSIENVDVNVWEQIREIYC